ncbi:MAG TPA: hypothetical protein VM370_01490 [Candidatus Thermoplasmatota archaeon]|nr:hypothetical protein [Candidatus Thermoplasmatota archaeon]
MLPRLATATVLLALLAGCLAQEPAAPAATAPEEGLLVDEARPDTAFGEIVTGPAVGPDLNATLAAAPKLIAGEWWRLRFDTPLSGTEQTDVVRIVADVQPDGYVIGMPHEGWAKELISYHSPALGDVGLDLSYATHNEIFQPVKFPLEQGATWSTIFATTPYDAAVESVEGTKATIVLTPGNDPQPTDPVYAAIGFAGTPIRLVYDASVHEVTRFESGIGNYEVVEHGYGFEGWTTIPRAEHTAIDHGQIGPANPGELPGPRTIEITGGFNRITLMQAVLPFAPGVYKARAVAPDGTELVTESNGEPVLNFYEVRDPDGTWTIEDTIAGAGASYTMGIAYHQYDIHLPDGAKRSDHSHEVFR